MEEVQSWWEIPSIAHFCYVFRSAFNLFFFEIAELESALLNIQDPDMSISLEQLIIRLLQGCYDEESVNEENWEEKLLELFSTKLEIDENPFSSCAYFFQLTPRSKVEVLLKLCEVRLDIEDVMEDIKNIPSEDMQAQCLGKDSENNRYWYFCDERLYKEDTSSGNKAKQLLKNKSLKTTPNKKQTNMREKRNKASLDIDKSWMIACFNLSDWEKLMQKFSKSKKSNEKELFSTIKDYLPLIKERVAEKDRLLRKRFLELAPKRSSSRISKVQEKKKNEELKAAEEAREARIKAEKEKARKESLMLKMKKESRQRRIEERHKAIEERAERIKLRELARDNSDNSDDDDDEEEEEEEDIPRKSQKVMPPRTQRNRRNIKWRYQESESEDEEKDCNASVGQFRNSSRQSTSRRTETTKLNAETADPNFNRYVWTYSSSKQQSSIGEPRTSSTVQSNVKSGKYQFDFANNRKTSSMLQCTKKNSKEESYKHKSEDESSCSATSTSINTKINTKNSSVSTGYSASKQDPRFLPNSYSNLPQNLSPSVALYKTVLQSSSDVSKCNSTLDSKRQKLHILHSAHSNLASKKFKLQQVKHFKAVSTNAKSLSKENQVYKPVQKAAFITFGKIIPSPSVVKLEFMKPPNPQVSS